MTAMPLFKVSYPLFMADPWSTDADCTGSCLKFTFSVGEKIQSERSFLNVESKYRGEKEITALDLPYGSTRYCLLFRLSHVHFMGVTEGHHPEMKMGDEDDFGTSFF